MKTLVFALFECCICCFQNAACWFNKTTATWKLLLVWVNLILSVASLGRVLILQCSYIIFFYCQIFCRRWSEKGTERKEKNKKRWKNARANKDISKALKSTFYKGWHSKIPYYYSNGLWQETNFRKYTKWTWSQKIQNGLVIVD